MIILNFSHPLSSSQETRICEITGQEIDQVIQVPVTVDNSQALPPQVQTILGSIQLSQLAWESGLLIKFTWLCACCCRSVG